jgi:hypothetical protein
MRLGLDVDGVIAKTPVRFLAVREHRGGSEGLPADASQRYQHVPPPGKLRVWIERLRFGWRAPVDGAADCLRRLAATHDVYLLTGRSEQGRGVLEAWLRREGLFGYVSGIWMAPPGLRTWEHKLVTCRELRLNAHVDDDPHTALYLARNGIERVLLIDPGMARRDAPRVTVVRDLRSACDALC